MINQKKVLLSNSLLILLMIFLNQTSEIFGINTSFSDFILILIVLLLIFEGNFILDAKSVLFFVSLMLSLLLSTLIVTPLMFSIKLNYVTIVRDFIKLIVSFLYYTVGMIYFNKFKAEKLISVFSYCSYLIGIIGFIAFALNIGVITSHLFFVNTRLEGFMNDPNYYSIIQNAAFAYLFTKNNSRVQRYILTILNFIIISLTGSKTGFVIFIVLLLFFLLEDVVTYSNHKKQIIKLIFLSTILVVFHKPISYLVTSIFDRVEGFAPIFSRIRVLLDNFMVGVTGSGSSRDATIANALGIIMRTPLVIGIGVGTYSSIGMELFGSAILAHNTYLQLFAEWGLVFSLFFYWFVFKTIIDATKIYGNDKEMRSCTNMLIVFMIGSLSISLNNARIFWLILGILHGMKLNIKRASKLK